MRDRDVMLSMIQMTKSTCRVRSYQMLNRMKENVSSHVGARTQAAAYMDDDVLQHAERLGKWGLPI